MVFRIIKRALSDCAGINENSSVMIICDKGSYDVASKFYGAASELGSTVSLYGLQEPRRPYQNSAIDRMDSSLRDSIDRCWAGKKEEDKVALTLFSAREDEKPFRKRLIYYITGIEALRPQDNPALPSHGGRLMHGPGFNESMAYALAASPGKMTRTAEKIKERLKHVKSLRITTPAGTDLHIDKTNRDAHIDGGYCLKPRDFINIPSGEVYLSPVIENSHGTMVVDGSIGVIEKAENNITFVLEKGRVMSHAIKENSTEARNEMERLLKLSLERDENARNIGELGIGLNPHASITGNLLIDEKCLKTVHVAIGNDYDGINRSESHMDCLMKDPTIEMDGKEYLMENGVLLI